MLPRLRRPLSYSSQVSSFRGEHYTFKSIVKINNGGGLLIHSDPFALIDSHLFVSVRSLSCTKTPHLEPNAYQVLAKNLSDLAAVSKTALEHTVALL
jgi:hypothetical protein